MGQSASCTSSSSSVFYHTHNDDNQQTTTAIRAENLKTFYLLLLSYVLHETNAVYRLGLASSEQQILLLAALIEHLPCRTRSKIRSFDWTLTVM